MTKHLTREDKKYVLEAVKAANFHRKNVNRQKRETYRAVDKIYKSRKNDLLENKTVFYIYSATFFCGSFRSFIYSFLLVYYAILL